MPWLTVRTFAVWYLKACPWLEHLTADQCSRLERAARIRSFSKGSTIYLQADVAEGVLLVAQGRVRISSITPQGKQAILAYIESGDLFGEQALLEQSPREEHAEAVQASEIVWLPAHVLREIMDESPAMTFSITRLIGLRRKRIERRLKSLLFRSHRDRLLQLLLDLSEQYGKATSEGTRLGIRLSHQELAGLIGSTRESVTVLLGELGATGQIRIVRRQIILCDPAEIVRMLHAPTPQQESTVNSADRQPERISVVLRPHASGRPRD